MSFHKRLNGTSGFFLVYTKTWTGYLAYRKDHPGPISSKSFGVWVGNGGRDREGFKWSNKGIKYSTFESLDFLMKRNACIS